MFTDPNTINVKLTKFLVWGLISCILLFSNLVGWHTGIQKAFDSVLSPFLIVVRDAGQNLSYFLQDINDKPNLAKENLELKRQMIQYEEIKALNRDLELQLTKLEQQTKISRSVNKKLQIVKVIGVQNLFSSSPEVIININGNSSIKVDSPVYFETNTLFGFVQSIEGNTAKVVPYYAPNVQFNIAVESVKDINQTGFVEPIANNTIKIRNVQKDLKVNTGDVWVTANVVPQVPAGLVIGKVKKADADVREGFQQVEIEVPFNLNQSPYLLIEQ
jgi:cell shape-determining protein MreC